MLLNLAQLTQCAEEVPKKYLSASQLTLPSTVKCAQTLAKLRFAFRGAIVRDHYLSCGALRFSRPCFAGNGVEQISWNCNVHSESRPSRLKAGKDPGPITSR